MKKALSLKKSPVIILSVVILFQFSCVPNKKLIYLQDNNVKENLYPRDSIVKAYDDQYRQYKLKPGDIISIRIGSLTPSEYNFVKQYEEQLGLIRMLNQYDEQLQNEGGLNRNIGQGYLNNQGQGGGGGLSTIYLDRQNTGFILDETGSLEMPRIGNMELRGLTLDEAGSKIQDSLKGYFETPVVRVQLLSFHFTVVGEVNKEGRYTTYNPKTNLFDAFIMAGNLTEFADRANIKIVRQVNDESMVIYINTLDQRTLQASNLYLYPDDMIIVPPLKARFWRKYVLPSTSTALSIVTTALSLIILVITLKK